MQGTNDTGGSAPAGSGRKRKKRSRGGGRRKRLQRQQRAEGRGSEGAIRAMWTISGQAACVIGRTVRPTVVPVGFAEEGELCHGFEPLVGSRVGLDTSPDARQPTAQYDGYGRWLVEALAVGDDSEDARGLVLEHGVPYATDQATSSLEGFHPIEWDGGLFDGVRNGAIVMPTYAIRGSRAEAMWDVTPDCVIPASSPTGQEDSAVKRSIDVARQVLDFLKRHPGVAVITSGIGAREAVEWEPGVRAEVPGQPRRTGSTHECIKAAIINAVFALRGDEVADLVQRTVDADPRLYTKFASVGEVLQAAKESQTRCRAARDPEVQRSIQSSDRLLPFRLLAEKRSGVFIVRLRAVKGVDHAVVVDANNRVVIDSEESSALVLSAEVLQRCGGDGERELRVTDVRRIKGRDE